MRLWLLGAVLAVGVVNAGRPAAAEPARTGFDFMSPQLQVMQRDDSQNPGMLWVQEGLALWARADGLARKSCADCHGATPAASLRGAATRYPAWDHTAGGAINLGQRVAMCRQRHQQAPPWATDSEPALALDAALAHASRGLPMAPPDDPRLAPLRAEGERLWKRRIGQLDLSCADCHDRLVGRRLGGSVVPPGNAAGYPSYRLEWQALGSLQRRIRNCVTGVRAQPWEPDSEPMRALELHLALRDRGAAMQAPSVRP